MLGMACTACTRHGQGVEHLPTRNSPEDKPVDHWPSQFDAPSAKVPPPGLWRLCGTDDDAPGRAHLCHQHVLRATSALSLRVNPLSCLNVCQHAVTQARRRMLSIPKPLPRQGGQQPRVSNRTGSLATRLRHTDPAVSTLVPQLSLYFHSIGLLRTDPLAGSVVGRSALGTAAAAGQGTRRSNAAAHKCTNVNSLDTARTPTPDNRVTVPSQASHCCERLSGHPGRRPLGDDHLRRDEHETASPLRHIKGPGRSNNSFTCLLFTDRSLGTLADNGQGTSS
jgi:hypothetical protein